VPARDILRGRIHPAEHGLQGDGAISDFLPGGERFSATHVPLGALTQTAYNLTSPQCQAKAEHPVSAAEMLRLLQNLLEDRFKLVLRRETKEIQASPVVLHIFNDAAPFHPYHARVWKTLL
jgi:uncharacterized protein (TIGR03435 family)